MSPDITFSVAVRSTRKLRIFVEDLHRVTRRLARLEAFFKRLFAVPLVGCDGFAPFLRLASTLKGDMTEQSATCRCHYCNNGIEFEASRKGEMVACPHCQMETQLFIPPPPPPLIPVIPPPIRKEYIKQPREINWPVLIWLSGGMLFVFMAYSGSFRDGGHDSFIYSFFMGYFAYAVISLAIFIYFFPTYIAKKNQKKNTDAIFILNLLAGWTFIGWVVAVVWAYTKD